MRSLLLALLLLPALACGGGGDATSVDGGVDGASGPGADGGGGLGPDGAPVIGAVDAGGVQIFLPTPYRQLADSPFLPLGLTDFQVEDFEDGEMNLPGAQLDLAGSSLSTFLGDDSSVDSVDGDDGDPTDGTCHGCEAWRTGRFLVSFDTTERPAPTHVGLVVTDCLREPVRFQARDAANRLLADYVTEDFCDEAYGQTTAEDRFIGIYAPQGVVAVYVIPVIGNMEADHIQIGWEE